MSDKPHILIVEARYYEDIGEQLHRGAREVLEGADASHETLQVPGAFEIPAAVKIAVRSLDFFAGRRRPDGFVALGCVIRGETSHYDHICQESARGLQQLSLDYALAIGYGILTCETRDQAWERARVDGRNKGGEAAEACLRMLEIKRQFYMFPR